MPIRYHAAGKRCAVCLDSLKLPIPEEQTLDILAQNGFKIIPVDVVALARNCISSSRYRRGARPSEAPHVVDCSSFVKWLYAERGIWLPRRSIQQREYGEVVPEKEVVAGDVVFVKGVFDWYYDDPKDGVGHVGIATGEGTVIHACDSKVNVIESSFESFVKLKFRGIRRYVPIDSSVITLEVPANKDVETDDDIRWIVLQNLPR